MAKKKQWCRAIKININELVSLHGIAGTGTWVGDTSMPSYYHLETKNRWTDVSFRSKEFYLAWIHFFGIEGLTFLMRSCHIAYHDVNKYNLINEINEKRN